MKNVILFSLLLFIVFVGCKKDAPEEPAKPATTDFRENYAGTFNIKYHLVKTIQSYHLDTTYYELTEISYQMNDSIYKGFSGDGKFPAIRFRKIGASSDTSSWVLGIDGNGKLYNGAPGLSGGFVTVDILDYHYGSWGSSGYYDLTYTGKRN